MRGLTLIKNLWRVLPLSDDNRWRLTTWILTPLLPFIRGTVVHDAYQREKEWHARRIRPLCGDTLPLLPVQMKEDIFVWGVIDWRFRIQRPQHLARGFCKRGYRVFYISTAFVNANRPGFEVESMETGGCLLNVRLHVRRRPAIVMAPPDDKELRFLQEGLDTFLAWTQTQEALSILQHPYWIDVARRPRANRIIYDCLDHHAGFSHTGVAISTAEQTLLRNADWIVTSSQSLWDVAASQNRNVALIRNAVDYAFFATQPSECFKDEKHRRVIGYYGGIAEWMDLDLLQLIASRFEDCLVLLVGADECGARLRLSAHDNVRLIGEVKYELLPYFLHGMDVCLLPFKKTPLTLAVNPVKVYEYLAAGKPVVSVDLPEISQFGAQVAVAGTHDEFLERIDSALSGGAASGAQERQVFAARNTWEDRVEEFVGVFSALKRA